MATNAPTRFPIRFDGWYRILSSALLLRPSDSYLDVTGDAVSVRMGWAFSAHFPRAAIASIEQQHRAPVSRGVHGYAGRWLVNGSGDRIVALDLNQPQRARVLGLSVSLRQLMVSVDDPAALVRALGPGPVAATVPPRPR